AIPLWYKTGMKTGTRAPLMKECSADGCRKAVATRGLCTGHYTRLIRHGDIYRGGPLQKRKSTKYTNAQWLSDHVDHNGDECLIWPFGRFANGYGQVCINKVNKVASREMCILANGEPPSPSHEAAHSCGNGHLG